MCSTRLRMIEIVDYFTAGDGDTEDSLAQEPHET